MKKKDINAKTKSAQAMAEEVFKRVTMKKKDINAKTKSAQAMAEEVFKRWKL